VGAKYDLVIRDAGDKSSANIIETVQLAENTQSYDLTAKEYQGGYIGKVWLELRAHTVIESAAIENFSNIVSSHNYFDDASGDGTGGSEYVITNRRHLDNVRRYLGARYKQTADIDMAGFALLPISQSSTGSTFEGEFTGVYDAGKGAVEDPLTFRTSERYKISNLTISQGGSKNVGLFALIGPAGIVRNVEMENCVVSGDGFAGAFAGINYGTIVSCHNTGASAAVSATTAGDKMLGGIARQNHNSISWCTNAAAITATGGNMLGGIAGQSFLKTGEGDGDTEVAFCGNTGSISGNADIGGIVGDCTPNPTGVFTQSKTVVRDSYNKGKITATLANNARAGGIIGRSFTRTEILRCHNTGEIESGGSAGGILGRLGAGMALLIKDCYNRGNVTSVGKVTNGNSNAAGIIATNGSPNSAGEIINCYNSGIIAAVRPIDINGLFHRRSATTITTTMGDCYAVDEDGKKQTETADISATPAAGASATYTNVAAAAMAQQATFANWDFESVWEMGTGMPKLRGLPE
jgi:hypothetical protein